jgi:hypothetical protein
LTQEQYEKEHQELVLITQIPIDDFLEVSDSLADKIGRPKRDERALMATEPGQDLDNGSRWQGLVISLPRK